MTATANPDTLQQLLSQENPFEGHVIVKTHQIWGEEFPDVLSLNAHASDTILAAIDQVKKNSIVKGIALIAPKGVGKSHILSRIRHHLKATGAGIFIYSNEYGDLTCIKSQFLQNLVSSLKKNGSQEVMQCQEIATALLREAFKKEYQPKKLIGQFLEVLKKNPNLVEKLQSQVLSLGLDIDNPYIIRALIWSLSPAHNSYAMNWLAGRELSEGQCKEMGLPEISSENREAIAFKNSIQILRIISRYSVPVICFDELDGTEVLAVDETGVLANGFGRAMVVASLVKDISNNSHKGVIITAMFQKTWDEEIANLASNNAMTDRIADETVALDFPGSDEVVELVASWLGKFYDNHKIVPPHRVYPFKEAKLRELGRSKPTVRALLQWCAKEFGAVEDPQEKLGKLWQEAQQDIEDFSDDNEKISTALSFGLQYLKGKTLEKVKIDDIDPSIYPKSSKYIHFKILGTEEGKPVSIGVGIVQHSHGRSVTAGLKRLTQYQDFGLTRGCLIRNKEIKKNSTAQTLVKKLTGEMKGEWISFKNEEVKELLALRSIYQDRDSYNISDDDITAFIQSKVQLNHLICEILSDPSGTAPAELQDEDSNLIDLPIFSPETQESDFSEPDDLFATAS